MKQQHAVAIGRAAVFLACLVLLGSALGVALAQPRLSDGRTLARAGTPSIGGWVLGSRGTPATGKTASTNDSLGRLVIGPRGGGDVSLQAGYWHEAALLELGIAKAAQPSSAAPGQLITYTIVVSNHGDAQATGAVVSDTLAPEVTFAGPVTLDPPDAGTVGTPPIVVWDAAIAAGRSITITMPMAVTMYVAPGIVTNTATVTCTQVATPVEGVVAVSVAAVSPTLGTVDPSSGRGPAGVTTYFTTTWMDDNGWADLKQCYFHIGDSPSLVGSVTLMYNAAKHKLWLRSDDGSTWTGGCAPGSDGMMQNGQAKVYCRMTTAGGADGTLTVKWAIEFKDGYTGAKKLGLKCKDRGKAKAKGKWKGTWSIE